MRLLIRVTSGTWLTAEISLIHVLYCLFTACRGFKGLCSEGYRGLQSYRGEAGLQGGVIYDAICVYVCIYIYIHLMGPGNAGRVTG